MSTYFISDLHIKDINERNGIVLLRFLNFLAEQKNPEKNQLFMLGDIFDLWVSDHSNFAEKYKALVDACRRLKDLGTKITYFEGNHDVHIDEFWTKHLGVEVYVEAHYFNIDGTTFRMEHGDLINQNDVTYLRYRSIIRHPIVEQIGHMIPGEVWDWVGGRASKKSRRASSKYRIERANELVQMIRAHGQQAYSQRAFDVIISGHMHVFDDYEFQVQQKNVRSINLGSWLEVPNALEFSSGKFIWRKDREFLRWLGM